MDSTGEEWPRSSTCARETEVKINARKPGLFKRFPREPQTKLEPHFTSGHPYPMVPTRSFARTSLWLQRLPSGVVHALVLLIWGLATASMAQPSAMVQPSVMAQAPVTASPSADPVRDFIHKSIPASQSGMRIDVSVGQLDPRLRLAPCGRIEPYLLPGTRLWGRTSIGVRCLEGAQWSVSLPVTVSVHGPALVAAEPLAAGSAAAMAPVRIEETELTREPGTPLTDPAQLVGRSLIRPIAAGQVIRMEHLRVQPTVAAGDPVRIEMMGRGFVVQAEGYALVAGGEGQPVRARTENGRIVAGTLRGQTVEVRL